MDIVTTTSAGTESIVSNEPHKRFNNEGSQSPPNTITSYVPSSKLPPTAMVAPLVGYTPPQKSQLVPQYDPKAYSPTSSPIISRHTTERHDYISHAFASPSLDRIHERSLSRGGSPPVKGEITTQKLRSLMNILSEKSQIIDRQKQTISKLQLECREKESQLRKFNRSEFITDVPSSSSSSSSAISAPVQVDILSRKLDSIYYELDNTKTDLETTQNKLQDKERYCMELEKQIEETQTKAKALEQQAEKLQGYLGNMPTMEEHYGLKEQVTDLHTQCTVLREQLKEKDDDFEKLRDRLKEKDESLCDRLSELVQIRQENNDLQVRVHSQDRRILELHSDNSQLKVELQKLQEVLSGSDSKLQQELHSMRERHRQRFLDATAKLKEQHKIVVKRNKILELQLIKNSDAITALNNELQIKKGTIGELKSSMNDLVTQNQSLVHQNLSLQETQSELARAVSPVPGQNIELTQKLSQELTLCVEDFESLVSLASSILEGKDPNTSLLLGVKGSGFSIEPSFSCDDTGIRPEKQLEHVQKLHSEVERLRTVLTEQYADQMASQCTVQ